MTKNYFYILLICLLCNTPLLAKSQMTFRGSFEGIININDIQKHISDENLLDIPTDSLSYINKISFGIKSGIIRSRMNFNKGFPVDDYSFKQKWKLGFTFGTFINIPLNEKWAIHQEYNYSQIRGAYIPFEAVIQLNYLSIPFFLKYSLNHHFKIIAGPQFDLLISGKQKIDNITEDITKITEERNIGMNLGLQYHVSKNCLVEIRFMHGLNNIGLWQRSGIKEFKQEVIVISGGYFFYKNSINK